MMRPRVSGAWIAPVVASALLAALPAAVSADEAAEKYVDDAMPYMYHTCKSVVAEANGDDRYIDKVIRAEVAVSLYNREIDVTSAKFSAARRAGLHDRFIAALGAGCRKDKNALLAGVIDRAIAHAVSDEPAKAFVP